MTENKRKGRPAKIFDDNFYRETLTRIDGGPKTAAEVGLSVYFIQKIIDEGLVEAVNKDRGKPGRGRPFRAYQLTSEGLMWLKSHNVI